MAQVMLGITTHELAFVTSNRALDFGRNPGGFNFRFSDYAHSPSYALPQLTSSYSTERGLSPRLQVKVQVMATCAQAAKSACSG